MSFFKKKRQPDDRFDSLQISAEQAPRPFNAVSCTRTGDKRLKVLKAITSQVPSVFGRRQRTETELI